MDKISDNEKNNGNIIFIILSMPLIEEEKFNIEIYMNKNSLSYEIIETQKKSSFNEGYSLLILKIILPLVNENTGNNLIEIKYNYNSELFGNNIKINNNIFFYYFTRLYPLKNDKNNNLTFLPQLNLTYSEEFNLFLECISKNNFTEKEKNSLKENLILNYRDNSSKEMSFNFLYPIFSLCIELNIPPVFIINKNISFDKIKEEYKNIKIDFFENLINLINKNKNKIENKNKDEELYKLKISQIFCEYYYKFNINIFNDLLNNKNKNTINGLSSLIEKKKISYLEFLNNISINKDSIMEVLLDIIKNKKDIEKIISIDDDFIQTIKRIDRYYDSLYIKYININ